MTDAAERHRQRVKRRYHRTLQSLEEARQSVKQLTLRHRSALERQRSLLAETQAGSRQEALQLYAEATDLVEELVKAKYKLQRDLELREKSSQRLWNLVLEQEDATDQKPLPLEQSEGEPEALFFTVDPFSVHHCAEIILPVYSDVRRVLSRHMSSKATDSVFGWHSRRLMDGERLHLSLQKVVTGTTSLELALKTWALLQGPIQFSELFSPSLNVRIRNVHVVNESNMILYDHFDSREPNGPMHCLYLVSMMKVDSGHVMLFQSIDRARLRITGQAPIEFNDPEHWLDVSTWYIFEDCEGEKDVNVILGGTIQADGMVRADSWQNEMVFLSMRWENKVIRPRPLLPSD